MAIRTIKWTVQEDGMSLTPATCQDGGVQGDHNKTRAEFVLPASLIDGYEFYIEYVDMFGGFDTTEQLTVEKTAENNSVSVLLPLAWTQHGGEATLRLVAIKEGEVGYTLAGRVRYHSRAGLLEKVKSLIEGCIQTMLTRMEAAAEVIENAEDAAEMASQALEEADEALKRVHGTNRIYVGGGDMPDDCNVQIDPSGKGVTFENNVLWECQGDLVLMEEDTENETGLQTIELSQKVSEQKSGVVLVFSGVNSDEFGVPSTPSNKWFNSFFIPKSLASLRGNGGLNFLLTGGAVFTNIGAKYIYIHDDKIVGYGNNNRAGTSNGITYDNSKFCLRYVIGV